MYLEPPTGSEVSPAPRKILPSIRSVLIRLALRSSAACIWISGGARAGVAHVPRPLRVPSAACQYAPGAVDQCLLNHFPK